LCPDGNLEMMAEKYVTTDRDASLAGEKPDRPEIRAEKVERKRFEEARKEHRIIDGVRTKIDKSK